MKSKHLLLISLVCFIIVVITVYSAFAAPLCTGAVFSDVPKSHPMCGFIEEMQRKGLTAGCGGGKFCPDAPVSRAQIAVFLYQEMREFCAIANRSGVTCYDPVLNRLQ